MDEKAILDRLSRLEESVKSLQASAPESKSREPRSTKFQTLCRLLLANWVLLSFSFAIATAVYVKFKYGVNYLHEYNSIKTKRELVDFHTRMGDILMGRGEWEAAEDAYRSAQQIDPESRAANLGIVRAQVFKPPVGEKAYVPEIADAKLSYLLSLYQNDDQLLFLKGVRLQDQNNDIEAMASFTKAIAKNKNFLGSYINLGFIYVGNGHFNIDLAIQNLEQALKLDPDYPVTHENLGFLYLLSLNFEKAVEHERRSFDISPKWSSTYSLGEAFLYSGDFAQALEWHKYALKRLTEAKSENDSFLRQSETLINYMPLSRKDRETIKSTVTVYNWGEEKNFYALRFEFRLRTHK